MSNMGFPSLGGPDPALGAAVSAPQSGAMRAPGPNAMRVPGPIGPLHGRQVRHNAPMKSLLSCLVFSLV